MEPLNSPLAEVLRPRAWEEVVGQDHLLGEEGLLGRLLQRGFLPSMVLFGPPGVGKTTLARLLAQAVHARFVELSAVHAGVKELKAAVEAAQQYLNFQQQTVLFIDEIHRFNTAQQDALLQAVERGTIRLIGATTEHPSFALNPALLSRLQVFTLQSLSAEALGVVLQRALDYLQREELPAHLQLILIHCAGGDARQLLRLVEQLAHAFSAWEEVTPQQISLFFQKVLAQSPESHYELISAFIKSIRGSDANAAIYWLARMLAEGEEVRFIARRLVIAASEDIGLANPNALLLANQTLSAVQQIGMPEARIPLAQCTIYLANSAKSNAAYLAINAAMEYVKKNPAYPVPLHLRNAPTSLMKQQGYGEGYVYTHDAPDTPQSFLPEAMLGMLFYSKQ